MAHKLFEIYSKKIKKEKKMGKIFFIKVLIYIVFDTIYKGRKFQISYLLSFRVKGSARVNSRNAD